MSGVNNKDDKVDVEVATVATATTTTQGTTSSIRVSRNNSNNNNMNHNMKRMEIPMGERPAARVVIRKGQKIVGRPIVTTTNNGGATKVSKNHHHNNGSSYYHTDHMVQERRLQQQEMEMNDDGDNDEQQQQQQKKDSVNENIPTLPVVGDIMERTTTRNRRCRRTTLSNNNNTTTMSSNYQVVDDGNNNHPSTNTMKCTKTTTTMMTNGFPSVNVPLGSFVRGGFGSVKKQQQQQKSSCDTSADNDDDIITTQKSLYHNHNSLVTNDTATTTSNTADQMIQSMSPMEIQETVLELRSTLSPSMIEFIQQRKHKKQQQAQQLNPSNEGKMYPTTTITGSTPRGDNETLQKQHKHMQQPSLTANTTTTTTTTTNVDTTTMEKVRISQLLSSIRTYEDLDRAYEMEMTNHHPKEELKNVTIGIMNKEGTNEMMLENTSQLIPLPSSTTTAIPNSSSVDDEKFQLACQLLRSTSIRQKLWAAQMICQTLQKDVVTHTFRHSNNNASTTTTPSSTCSSLTNDHANHPVEDDILPSGPANQKENVTTTSRVSLSPLLSSSSYPSLLPVSLRCLLDESLSSKMNEMTPTNRIVHAYVLQSIYSLLLLHTPLNLGVHVVVPWNCFMKIDPKNQNNNNNKYNMMLNNESSMMMINPSVVYQLYFMDDAIPQPPIRSCYPGATTTLTPIVSNDKMNNNNSVTDNGIYSTTSTGSSNSSNSATTDGDAFYQDPMWTLVSKMKMIPRIAQILQAAIRNEKMNRNLTTSSLVPVVKIHDNSNNSNMVNSIHIPVESLISICGILGMIGQRSPGAASALMQHTTLVPDLTELCLQFPIRDGTSLSSISSSSSSRYDPILALPYFIFLCTMTRQSRTAAISLQRIDIDMILVQILTTSTTAGTLTNTSHPLECLLQRYALILWRTLLRYGLCLTIAPTMLTLATPHVTTSRSLGTISNDNVTLSADYYSCFTGIVRCIRSVQLFSVDKIQNNNTNNYTNVMTRISEDQCAILSKCCIWLSATKRQAINHLIQETDEHSCFNSVEELRLTTSIIRYLDVLKKVTSQNTVDDTSEFKAEEFSPSEDDQCVKFLVSLLKSNKMNEILNVATFGVSSHDLCTIQTVSSVSIQYEASACALIESVLSFLSSLSRRNAGMCAGEDSNIDTDLKEIRSSLVKVIESKFLASTKSLIDTNSSCPNVDIESMSLPRRRWLNVTHAAMFTFLQEYDPGHLKPMIREIGWALVGRLERGEERTAALLFSMEDLFTDPKQYPEHSASLSNMMMKELCRTHEMQKQLDHSFRLHNGPGIVPSGLGPFQLDTLLSECDGIPPGRETELEFLPLGKFWPWKLLSGSLVLSEQQSTIVTKLCSETSEALLSVLHMINGMEKQKSDFHQEQETSFLGVGGKLYYLVNLCLLPEEILANKQVHNAAENLFNQYFDQFHDSCALEFAYECLSNTLKPTAAPAKEDDSELPTISSNDEKMVKSMLDSDTIAEAKFTKPLIRALTTFFGDLCDGFLEYGYQYNLFVKTIRLFLTIGFPIKIRCEVTRRLREVLHLLTRDEDDVVSEDLLSHYLLGGLPVIDNSLREQPEWIDSMVSLLSPANSIRSDAKLVREMAIGTIARSLAITVTSGGLGLSVSKRRMMKLDISIAREVFEVVYCFLASDCTMKSLIHQTHAVTSSKAYSVEWFRNAVDNESWDTAINVLRQRSDSDQTLPR